jgi:pantoate kinase
MAGTSVAFSPCQITGFFRIHDGFKDANQIGSTGTGICVEQGVTTRVRLNPSSHPKDSILLNGKPLARPVVSRIVLRKFREKVGTFSAKVAHSSDLPVGCGYGTSGAGALSLAFATNEILGQPVKRLEAAQIAHVAEVEARTGLGTVASEFTGGVVVRLKPGAPGIGSTQRFRFGQELRVVSGSFGPFRKKRVLGNVSLSDRVNSCAENLVSRFLQKPDSERFVKLSRRFTECLSLKSARLDHAMRYLASQGFMSSMMMLGESLFCLVDEESVGKASKALTEARLKPVVSKIAYRGARLI